MRIPFVVAALSASMCLSAQSASEAIVIEYDINGSFEERLRGWQETHNTILISDSDGYGQSRKTSDRVGAQDSRHFIALELMSKWNDGAFGASVFHPLVGIRPGDTLVLTGYVRSDVPLGQFGGIGVCLYDGDFFPRTLIHDVWQGHSVEKEVSSEWQYLSSATYIPEDFNLQDIAVQLLGSGRQSGGRVLFDNVELKVFREK